MKLVISTILALFTTINILGQNQSPQLISSSANTQLNDGIQLTWSLGETFTETFTSSNSILSQGFIQSNYDVKTIVTEPTIIGLTVFPNPATDHLVIQIGNILPENLTYQLIHINGQICTSGIIVFNTTKITIDPRLPNGIYILRLNASDMDKNQSFKISINR